MGAKTWMLVYANGNVEEALRRDPRLDRDATLQFATDLFPKDRLEPIGDGDLSFTCPRNHEVHAGCFADVRIVAAKEFGIDYPSRLEPRFLARGSSGTVYLHAMHSVVDWFACAVWINGKLARSLSVSPDSGIMEDLGEKLPFEEPFWAGKHPASDDHDDDYPFPFHPLELGEAALKAFFGYQLEGFGEPAPIAPESIPLVKYKRVRSRWRFW